VGTSADGVTVYVDPSLGNAGLQNATTLSNNADDVVTHNARIFGGGSSAVNVIVYALGGQTDGTGGADHAACDFVNGGNLEVDATFDSNNPDRRILALFEAELSECAMNGNLCGLSTGEALSRWCAAVVSENALSDFATAPQWAQDGMPDYVNTTAPTDRDPDSTGCGMAFISWLQSEGKSLSSIAEGMVGLGDSGTLADLYAQLTGKDASNAWTEFINAVSNLPNGITNDDPFGAGFAGV
jgi:hypothetical protein